MLRTLGAGCTNGPLGDLVIRELLRVTAMWAGDLGWASAHFVRAFLCPYKAKHYVGNLASQSN